MERCCLSGGRSELSLALCCTIASSLDDIMCEISHSAVFAWTGWEFRASLHFNQTSKYNREELNGYKPSRFSRRNSWCHDHSQWCRTRSIGGSGGRAATWI